MTYLEMFNTLSKQWANVNDIKTIGSCGRDEATKVRNDIANCILKKGYNLPISKTKVVPMENVIEYFNLNIEHIYKMAEKEKNIIKEN